MTDAVFETTTQAKPGARAVIEVINLSKIYQAGGMTIRAVDDASFTVYEGEFIALVGPSGSGKTTLLAMMAALLEPSDGKVLIDGQNLAEMKENERVRFRREKIGFTFQSNNLVPYLNVRENVELMLRMNGRTKKSDGEYLDEMLKRLGLEERLRNLPRQLSGGQQQRVSIARALIHNPSLVLADEPTASLDTERAYQVTQIFADLIHEQRKAGIMVTHDLRLCQYVDRVVQIGDGRIENILASREEIDAFISCR